MCVFGCGPGSDTGNVMSLGTVTGADTVTETAFYGGLTPAELIA